MPLWGSAHQALFRTAGPEVITFPRPKCQLFGFRTLIGLPEYNGTRTTSTSLAAAGAARVDLISGLYLIYKIYKKLWRSMDLALTSTGSRAAPEAPEDAP